MSGRESGRVGETEARVKACSRCAETKPLDDFYANANGMHGRMPYCKRCDNARPRKTTAVKVNRMRARHRAVADLIAMHSETFEALLAQRLAETQEEAEALAATPEAREHYTDEPVRLRPGPRMSGQKAGDRIDVARCRHCIKHHDQGHVCTSCGLAPIGALRLPDDGTVDEIAVERAMHGDPVRLTPAERVEAVRRLASRGSSHSAIAERLHVTKRTVERICAERGIRGEVSA